MKQARRKWTLALTSLCLTLFLGLVAGEIVVRRFSPEGYVTPDTLRADSVEYEATVFSRHAMMQKAQMERRRGTWRINSKGYRGREFTVTKPADAVRIVVLGGSAAFDIQATEGRDWPHLVEDKLHAAGHTNVEIINAGTGGHAACDSLGRLYSEIWMFEPDYVLVYHGWNDIKYFCDLSEEQSLLRTIRPQPMFEYEGQMVVWNPYMYYQGRLDRFLCHSQLYVRLRNRFWSLRLGTIGLEGLVTGKALEHEKGDLAYPNSYSPLAPRQFELTLRLIVAASRAIGAKPVLITQPWLVAADNTPTDRDRIRYDYAGLSHEALLRASVDCRHAVLSVAKEEDALVLDLAPELSGRGDLFTDHVHTTAAGSELLATRVSRFLANLLGEQEREVVE